MHQDAGELYVISLRCASIVNVFQWGIVVVDTKNQRIFTVEPQLGGQFRRLHRIVVVAIT